MLRILRVLNLIKKASFSNWVGILKAVSAGGGTLKAMPLRSLNCQERPSF